MFTILKSSGIEDDPTLKLFVYKLFLPKVGSYCLTVNCISLANDKRMSCMFFLQAVNKTLMLKTVTVRNEKSLFLFIVSMLFIYPNYKFIKTIIMQWRQYIYYGIFSLNVYSIGIRILPVFFEN